MDCWTNEKHTLVSCHQASRNSTNNESNSWIRPAVSWYPVWCFHTSEKSGSGSDLNQCDRFGPFPFNIVKNVDLEYSGFLKENY